MTSRHGGRRLRCRGVQGAFSAHARWFRGVRRAQQGSSLTVSIAARLREVTPAASRCCAVSHHQQAETGAAGRGAGIPRRIRRAWLSIASRRSATRFWTRAGAVVPVRPPVGHRSRAWSWIEVFRRRRHAEPASPLPRSIRWTLGVHRVCSTKAPRAGSRVRRRAAFTLRCDRTRQAVDRFLELLGRPVCAKLPFDRSQAIRRNRLRNPGPGQAPKQGGLDEGAGLRSDTDVSVLMNSCMIRGLTHGNVPTASEAG